MKTADTSTEYEKAWAETDAPAKPAKVAVLGNGMVDAAATAVNSRDYKLHVEEAKSLGEKPMTQEEFVKKSSSKKA